MHSLSEEWTGSNKKVKPDSLHSKLAVSLKKNKINLLEIWSSHLKSNFPAQGKSPTNNMNRGYVNGGERKVFHKEIDDVGGVQLKKIVVVSGAIRKL